MNSISQERRDYLQEKHGLHVYHFKALDALLGETNLSGKRVLEIGGSNMPRELVSEDLRAEHWVSVDMVDMTHYARAQQIEHYRREPIYPLAEAEHRKFGDSYTIFNGAAEHIGPRFFGEFDVVVSITAFEHIGRLATVLRRCYQALRPGGLLFSYFGPLYSCRVGHHCWVTPELNFNNPGPLPDFCHLLMKPADLLEVLREHYPIETAEEAVHQIYYSDRVTRNLYEDYEAYMTRSPFEEFECRPYGVETVDADLQRRLTAARPGYANFAAYGMEIIARKLSNTTALDHLQSDRRPIAPNIPIRHPRERDLLPHYAAHLEYFTPLDTVDKVAEIVAQAALEPGRRILDLGCGDGRVAYALAAHFGMRVVGVDYCKERLEIAKARCQGLSCEFIHADVNFFSETTSERFEYAIAVEVLEHLEHPEKVLDALRPKISRKLLGSVPLRMPYAAHLQVYDSAEDACNRLRVDVLKPEPDRLYFQMPGEASCSEDERVQAKRAAA